MAKSKGNFYILKDVLDKGYSEKAVRYLLLSTHYRQKLNFTYETLDSAENIIKKFKEFLMKLKAEDSSEDNSKVDELIKQGKEDFEKSLDDDLNISGALAAVFQFMTEINKLKISRKDALKAFNLMMEFDKVLGVFDFAEDKIPKEIQKLANKREQARKDKDWKEADKLRDKIKEKGYSVDDTEKGSVIKKI